MADTARGDSRARRRQRGCAAHAAGRRGGRRARFRSERRDAHGRDRRACRRGPMILDIGPATSPRIGARLGAMPHPGLERPARRLRDAAVRCRHDGDRPRVAELTRAGALLSVAGGGDTVAALAACRGRRPAQLCLDRRRRVSRMAGRPRAARRGGAQALTMIQLIPCPITAFSGILRHVAGPATRGHHPADESIVTAGIVGRRPGEPRRAAGAPSSRIARPVAPTATAAAGAADEHRHDSRPLVDL